MSSRSVMIIRQAHIDGERERKEAKVWRDEYIKETTRLWKEGFARLKVENDERQLEAYRTYKSKLNDAWYKENTAIAAAKAGG